MGERYLDALDYEQAIAAFEEAIHIDPKNEDAYRLLAETYDKMGMENKATEILRNGYVATGSRELKLLAEEDYDIDITQAFLAADTEDKLVIRQTGLDVCFVIDTTGSMSEAIDDAKKNMEQIVEQISQKSSDYRVAIVDYRDFASRTGDSFDYSAKLQLDFCSEINQIQAGINKLSTGYGGDEKETVYSGLMLAASLGWRADAQHVVILIGDAAPLSPEPVTGYTYDDIVEAFRTGEVDLDSLLYDGEAGYGEGMTKDTDYAAAACLASDIAVVSLTAGKDGETAVEDSGEISEKEIFDITLYGIVTNDNSITKREFESLCENTGGTSVMVGSESSLSEEICGIIEQVEVVPVSRDVVVGFGLEFGSQEIVVYQGGQILNTVSLGANGKGTLKDMLFGTYFWKDAENGAFGYLTVSAEEEKAKIIVEREPNADRILMIEWVVGASVSGIILIVASILVVTARRKKQRQSF